MATTQQSSPSSSVGPPARPIDSKRATPAAKAAPLATQTKASASSSASANGGPTLAPSPPPHPAPPPSRRHLRKRLSGKPPAEAATTATTLLSAGACSGAVSKLLTAPVDRVKIIYQVDRTYPFSVPSAIRTAREIVSADGPSALWRGNSAAVARDVPYAAILFCTFSVYEEALEVSRNRPSSVGSRLLAGSAAGATATCLTYPLDVIRARLAAESISSPVRLGYAQGVGELFKQGGPGAFFHGLRPTLLGIVPYSGLSFAAFETIKTWMRTRGATTDALVERELNGLERFVAGAAAGAFAQTLTYPLTVVRRRMQVHGVHVRGSLGHVTYQSVQHALRSIYKHEGIANGLFKGLSLSLLKGPLQSAIGFVVNDYARKWMGAGDDG
jgi:solute carrier family 25 protein 42